LALPGDAESLEERLPVVAEEFTRTMMFYNSSHMEHPLDAKVPVFVSGDLEEAPNGQSVCVAGMVNYVRRHTTRKGDPMAFVGLEDVQGTVEVVVFPRIWKETQEMWQVDKIVLVQGKVDLRGREPKIICDRVRDNLQALRPASLTLPPKHGNCALSPPPDPPRRSRQLTVFIKRSSDYQRDIAFLGDLRELLMEFKGDDSFRFHLIDNQDSGLELTFPNDRTNYCPALERELVSMLGPNSFRVE